MIASASRWAQAHIRRQKRARDLPREVAREREAIQMNGPELENCSPLLPGQGLPEDDAQHMVNHIATIPISCYVLWPASALAPLRKHSPTAVSASSGALSTAIGPVFRHPFFFMHGLERSSPRQSSRWPRTLQSAPQILDYSALLVVLRVEMTLVGAAEGAVTTHWHTAW